MTKIQLALGVCLLAFASCSLPPVVTPSVRQTAEDFGSAMDDFTDKALLANVLRARDFAPLNFAELTNISGQLNYSEQISVATPFGYPYPGGTRNLSNTGVSGSSTPTVTLGTLNTQNFITTMMQPVPATYIASKWNDGHSHALLLYLFVKSIQFAGDAAPEVNDPEHMAEFRALIDQMLAQNVSLHSLLLLDPVGSPLVFASNSTTAGAGMQIQMGTSPAISALNLINGLNDGQLHSANANCTGGGSGCAQIYKEYPATIALCLPTTHDTSDDQYKFAGHVVYPAPERGAAGSSRARAGLALLGATAAGITPQIPGSNNNGGGGGGGGGPGGGASGPAGGQSSTTIGAMPELNAALAGDRVSAILDRNDCGTDQIVLGPGADQALESNTPRAAKIEWRSVSEVIEYLGAIARNQNDPSRVPMWDQGQTLFHVNNGSSGRVSVTYQGNRYSIPGQVDGLRDNDPNNHALEALGLLNQLIGTAKQSTDLPQL